MGEAKSLTEQWKERAAQKQRDRQAEVVSVPVTFGGFEGRAHRLLLMDWAMAGRLPQYLASAMFAAVQGKTVEKKESDTTPEELAEWLKFQCIAFCAMMDEPKFTTNENPKDDEISYAEFVLMCPDVVKEAVQWQLDGCPNIPVQTESGEVSVADLSNFRNFGEGSPLNEPQFNSENVWWKTEPTPRIM